MVDLVPRLSLHCHIFCLCSPLFGNKDGVLVQDRMIKCAYMDQNRDKRAIKSDRGHKRNVFWGSFVHTLARAQAPLGPCLKNVTLMDGAKTGLKVRVCVPTVKSAPRNRIRSPFPKSQKHLVTSLL